MPILIKAQPLASRNSQTKETIKHVNKWLPATLNAVTQAIKLLEGPNGEGDVSFEAF